MNRQPRLKPGTSGQRPFGGGHGTGGSQGSPVPYITDHAVLRYLERAYGLDVEAVRHEMTGPAQAAIDFGAKRVTCHGVVLILESGRYVVTALRRRRR